MNNYYLDESNLDKYFMKLIPDFSVFDIAERKSLNEEKNNLFYYKEIEGLSVYENDKLIEKKDEKYDISIENNETAKLIISGNFIKNAQYNLIFEDFNYTINSVYLKSKNNNIIGYTKTNDEKNNIYQLSFNTGNNELESISIEMINGPYSPSSSKSLLNINIDIDESNAKYNTTFYRAIFKVSNLAEDSIKVSKTDIIRYYLINGDYYIIVITKGDNLIILDNILDLKSSKNLISNIKIIGVAF